MSSQIRKRLWRGLETLLLVVGIAMLTLYGASRLYTEVASRIAVLRFRNSSPTPPSEGFHRVQQIQQVRQNDEELDLSLWDEKRIVEYRQALTMNFDPAVAILSIPRLRLEVPVFNGTDEVVLNRGAGRIKGTARPGEAGNMGIAGHRDGFFRVLKDIHLGDKIELLSMHQKFTYVVDDIVVVSPDDVQVLQPRPKPSLTLVTCYPFYFVGDAPQRYIVHASEAWAHLVPIPNHGS